MIKTVLKEYYDAGIEMICIDSLKHRYYLILAGGIVDYKEQVLITGIKANMQYFICYISPQEQENLTKLLQPGTQKSTLLQLEQ